MLSVIAQSCKKSFIATNTSPNKLSNTLPQYLFAGATADLNSSRSQIEARYRFMIFMQYIVPSGSNALLGGNFDNPSTTTGTDAQVSYYNDYYSGVGLGMNRIIAQIDAMPAAQKATYADIRSICEVLDTYAAWRTVDIFGAMPYTQAFNPTQYPLPAYDYDYTLYKTFDAKLKSAATELQSQAKNQVNLGVQDFFYGGDTPSWLAFANTLRIKIAQRYEKRDAANLAAVLVDIKSNFSGTLISSNAQNFGIHNSKTDNDDTDDIDGILNIYDASYAFVEFLKSTNDPRLPMLVRQNDMGKNSAIFKTVLAGNDPQALTFIGQDTIQPYKGRYYGKHAFPASENDPAYGLTGGNRFITFNVGSGTQALDYLSVVQGCYFVKGGGFVGNINSGVEGPHLHTDEVWNTGFDPSTVKMQQMWTTYGETCFMMAEIANGNGGTALGKSAAAWYNAGVQASFDQYSAQATAYGIPADLIPASLGDYLTRYPYDGTLQRIYSQAWVHYMVQPEDAYALWKRTGYPQLVNYRAGQPTTAGNIGDGTGTAYIENIWDGTQNLLIPRRMAFQISTGGSGPGSGATLNSTNFFNAITAMQTKDASYGASGTDTKGRIWWDQ